MGATPGENSTLHTSTALRVWPRLHALGRQWRQTTSNCCASAGRGELSRSTHPDATAAQHQGHMAQRRKQCTNILRWGRLRRLNQSARATTSMASAAPATAAAVSGHC
eukprot:13981810-Alexandrium_andersonii.AAC.1